jgi:hypothetical protein
MGSKYQTPLWIMFFWCSAVLLSEAKAFGAGPPKLKDVLQVSLIKRFPSWDSCKTVLLSTPNTTSVFNTIFLNIANVGQTPLYKGKTPWMDGQDGRGPPLITVTFALGDNATDLQDLHVPKTCG